MPHDLEKKLRLAMEKEADVSRLALFPPDVFASA
jgi:hypothetical protein